MLSWNDTNKEWKTRDTIIIILIALGVFVLGILARWVFNGGKLW